MRKIFIALFLVPNLLSAESEWAPKEYSFNCINRSYTTPVVPLKINTKEKYILLDTGETSKKTNDFIETDTYIHANYKDEILIKTANYYKKTRKLQINWLFTYPDNYDGPRDYAYTYNYKCIPS